MSPAANPESETNDNNNNNNNNNNENMLSKDPSVLALDVPEMNLPTAAEETPAAAATGYKSPTNDRIKRIYSSKLGIKESPASKPVETADKIIEKLDRQQKDLILQKVFEIKR